MYVGIYVNPSKAGSNDAAENIGRILKKYGIKFFSADNIRTFYDKSVDVMFVIGGDGTILAVNSFCVQCDIPMLGINLGNIGFLTEVETDLTGEAVKRVVDGQYDIEERLLLETTYAGEQHIALNDIVLARADADSMRTQIVQLDAFVDGRPLYRYMCDGVVLASPTGSTAYSLSCGGAVLEPHLDAIEIVAICPHSLNTKPVVLPSSSVVSLQSNSPLNLVCDGRILGVAPQLVEIRKHDKHAKFIRLNSTGFYEKLVKKLSKWSEIKGD